MRKRVTLKDIARHTGYHVSTVSRALDENSRIALTQDVVVRIRSTADAMGYRRNRLASGLRTNRTMTIGVVIPDITNALFPPMLRGIESVLEPEGYASIIVNTDNVPAREEWLVDVLTERGVDGVLHAATTLADRSVTALTESAVPVVTLNRRVEAGTVPHVVSDDAAGVAMMLAHLVASGHRRVAHIAGPQALSTGAERAAAFTATCAELGLAAADCPVVAAARFDDAEGARCAAALLDGGATVTAILTANDRLALGTVGELQRRGLAVPRDISVTGFNDIPLLSLIEPQLTTIRVPQFALGEAAARLLLELLAHPGGPLPNNVVLPVALVERGSVARPPAAAQRTRTSAGAVARKRLRPDP